MNHLQTDKICLGLFVLIFFFISELRSDILERFFSESVSSRGSAVVLCYCAVFQNKLSSMLSSPAIDPPGITGLWRLREEREPSKTLLLNGATGSCIKAVLRASCFTDMPITQPGANPLVTDPSLASQIDCVSWRSLSSQWSPTTGPPNGTISW